ncbi:L-2,4-diaminobutyrate decarboxylase [Tenacibaculum sp. MAR_2009_124]|uniref:pyridoxal phosphate-dependent decarboxylase family protein n=1 Tax=Tenacibaculum sp. MAR_2009_124 TaxID=1250059 RepID=UPI0008976391|nr:pyridoxal-dependent decarboxylase [Tenacibaculum sp. MAR_2009_124]SED16889.1 L-2,4-diaminobutyrate decarboxylase [Tenacibaculum sp. MAR_2009_124]
MYKNNSFDEELMLLDHDISIPKTQKAFDANILREAVSVAVKKLSKNINNTSSRGLQLIRPNRLEELVEEYTKRSHKNFDGEVSMKIYEEIVDLYIATGIPVYSTGYMGRQFSGVVPIAGLTDLLTSMMSQPSSFYESAQLPSIVEKVISNEFGNLLEWKKNTYDVVTTSGGSLANITALLTARNCKIPNFYYLNNSSKGVPAVAMSSDVHYSVKRAVGILGIGEDQIVSLPVNKKGQICMIQAEQKLEEAEASGLSVFCLVASAGTTPVGAIDPLNDLAELCKKKNYWLHVDGAHAGSFLVSEKLRGKLQGIELADSFTLDAHKTMFLPASCTLLFYKNKEAAQQTFYKKASYIFESDSNNLDGGEKSFECTKRPMIMNLWIPWVLYGREFFAQKLEELCATTKQAYYKLKLEKDFYPLHKPEANILCFRYSPENINDLKVKDVQLTIRDIIKEDGKFFISKVEIEGETALRVVFMNHEVTMVHFNELLTEIKRIGESLVPNKKTTLNE